MDGLITMRLEMGGQVLAHSKAHPSDDPNHTALVVRLEDRHTRGLALTQQAVDGEFTVHSSVRGKEELKQVIRQHLMALNGVAQLASVEQAGIEVLIQVPPAGRAHSKFLAVTRVMLGRVTENSDIFRRHGLPDTFVAEVTALTDQYERAVRTKQSGTQTHVGANADLEAVTMEIMRIAKALDRLNRVRFRKDPERLATWKSARDMPWPSDKPEGASPVEPAA